jgi:pyruvate-formate lyase
LASTKAIESAFSILEDVCANQTMACRRCGFSPFADETSTARDIAFDKIRLRVEGNNKAGRELAPAQKANRGAS